MVSDLPTTSASDPPSGQLDVVQGLGAHAADVTSGTTDDQFEVMQTPKCVSGNYRRAALGDKSSSQPCVVVEQGASLLEMAKNVDPNDVPAHGMYPHKVVSSFA